jgi:hypothetical protein
MKSLVRLVAVMMLFAVMLPALPTRAQDGQGTDALLSEDDGLYIQSAVSGTLADHGDGTQTLTLQGVGPQMVWVLGGAAMTVRYIDAVYFSLDWAAMPDLSTPAVLAVGNLNILMTLKAPAYDAATQTQTYVVAVTGITTTEDTKDEPPLPSSFDLAYLSIAPSSAFLEGLVAGAQTGPEGVRSDSCSVEKQQCDDATQAATLAQEAYNAAAAGCSPLGPNGVLCMSELRRLKIDMKAKNATAQTQCEEYRACVPHDGNGNVTNRG